LTSAFFFVEYDDAVVIKCVCMCVCV
jgi:hypothetical protein